MVVVFFFGFFNEVNIQNVVSVISCIKTCVLVTQVESRTVPHLAVGGNPFFPAASSWLSGVGQDGRGLREAAVYAGADP